jgi:glycosyltransferase involved in cell wall biosynthesis
LPTRSGSEDRQEMTSSNPRVSIGLPVYNGEQFLKEALDSILAQTYTDFELVISDNASTDGTETICRAYAAKDQRIRYYRNEENLGASWNFNRVFELSSSDYFKWIAHDDICAPNFLLRCIMMLDQDPFIVVCYPRAIDIDEHGRFLMNNNSKLDIGSIKPHRRLHDLICINHSCLAVFGVIRASVLRRTSLVGRYVASDRVLLAELGLWGRFYQVQEDLFFHREHPSRSTRIMPTLHSRKTWFDPTKEHKIVFPTWKLFARYISAIRHTPLAKRERAFCYLQMVPWLWLHWKGMIGDVVIIVRQIFVTGDNSGLKAGKFLWFRKGRIT